MAKKSKTPVTASSGNVFADLGFAEPEEELTKAQLASQIREIIKRQHLTQIAAAKLMGVDQPKVSALFNGRLANFSSDRLMRLLTALGQDVEIVVKAKPRGRERGRIRVVEHAHA
jgi:predicted XRE-type DNA-binding protein